MSESSWFTAAEARWAHLPEGEERDRRVARTYQDIQHEAEQVALELPELDNAEKKKLLDEAVLDIWLQLGNPPAGNAIAEDIWHHRVDTLFAALCVAARERKADPRIRLELSVRRTERRLRALLGVEID